MLLTQYNKKRDFKATPEPKPVVKKSKGKLYVIQKHNASHLHWDLRLEMDGVLKSWAVPKEPPRTKANKRLAIQTEDHPVGYGSFEGEIPEGHYGAGKVKIWDSGIYEIEEKDKKKIVINIKGKKLKGKYVLVKTNYGAKPEKSWLFFKL